MAGRWSRRSFTREADALGLANAVRLQLHALTYNLGTFMRTLAMPKGVERWTDADHPPRRAASVRMERDWREML